MSPNGNDHDGGDHDHDPPSGNDRPDKPEAEQSAGVEEASSSLDKRSLAESAAPRIERERPRPKAHELPVNATKPGNTDLTSGSAGPLRPPEGRIQVRSGTRSKHYPKQEDPQEGLVNFFALLKEIYDWYKAIKNAHPLEVFKDILLEEPGLNPEWSQPPMDPAQRVRYFDNLIRHYEHRLEYREAEVLVEAYAPQKMDYPAPNIKIQSNSLCLANSSAPAKANIRAAQPPSGDSMKETQVKNADIIIAGDLEAQELREILREVTEKYLQARKDLDESRQHKIIHRQQDEIRSP